MYLIKVLIINSEISLNFALLYDMTDFCQTFSMWRVFDTLDSRAILDPTLRSLRSLSIGLLRFSIFDAVEKSVKYCIRAYVFYRNTGKLLYTYQKTKIHCITQ